MKIIKKQQSEVWELNIAPIVYRISNLWDFSFYEVRINLPKRYFIDIEVFDSIIPEITFNRYVI